MAKLTYTLSPYVSTTGVANVYQWFDLNVASAWLRSNGLPSTAVIDSAYITIYVATDATGNMTFEGSLYADSGSVTGVSSTQIIKEQAKGGSLTNYLSFKSGDVKGNMNASNVGYFNSNKDWLLIHTYVLTARNRERRSYYTLEVNFTVPTYTVTTGVSPSGAGTVTGGGTYEQGKTATLTATPATGYRFVKWSENNSTANPLTVSVSGAATYTAVFEKSTYNISVTASPSNVGSVSGGGTYTHGNTATLTATPNTGYKFVKWSDGNTSNPRTFTVTGGGTYNAEFEPITYYVTYSGAGALPTQSVKYDESFRTYSRIEDGFVAAKIKVTFDANGGTCDREYQEGECTLQRWQDSDTGTFYQEYQVYSNLRSNDGDVVNLTARWGGVAIQPPYPTRAGYKFLGWQSDLDGFIYLQLNPNQLLYWAFVESQTLVALWEKSTYRVRWYNEDGSQLLETDTDVQYGTIPEYNGATPTKPATAQSSYTFIGWNVDPTTSGTVELTAVVSDIDYYARFKEDVNQYTVTWKNYDGFVLETDTLVPYGTPPDYNGDIPARPDSDDGKYTYTFLGWSASVFEGAREEENLPTVSSDIVYTAVYVPIIKKYSLDVIGYDCTIESRMNGKPIGGDISGVYEYGTVFKIKVNADFGYEFDRIIDELKDVEYTDPELDFVLMGDVSLICICKRALAPIFISLAQQIKDVYVVPEIKTIVHRVEGELPKLENIDNTVDGWSFAVINTDIEDSVYGINYQYYPLEKLFISGTRVW